MTRMVVTGGAGFIGSHVVDTLLADGKSVTVIDNLESGSVHNLGHCMRDIDFVCGDVGDTRLLDKHVLQGDVVIHLAATPSVPRCASIPRQSTMNNVVNTVTLLDHCASVGVSRFVYASSSSVYGDSPTLPKHEGMTPLPRSLYAAQKLSCENIAMAFHRDQGMSTIGLRFFNVYGPRQSPASPYAAVIPKFARLFLANESPVVFGDGTTTRDFTFVKDVSQAVHICAMRAEVVSGTYNVATGNQYSLNDVVRELQQIIGCDLPVRYDDFRAGDIKDSLADISKLGAYGYRPRYSFAQGLKRTVDAIRNQSSSGVDGLEQRE